MHGRPSALSQGMASQTSPKDDARGWRIRARLRALYHGSSRQAVRFRFTVLIIDIVIIGFFIAAPILKVRPPLSTFAGLALLAGGPAVVGIWVGSLAYAPQRSALALAIGAGAIVQVIVEVSVYMARSGRGAKELVAPAALAGLFVGIAFMYLTAMLVKI